MSGFVPPKPAALSEKPGLLARARASVRSSLSLFQSGSYDGVEVSRFSIPTWPTLKRRWLYTVRDPAQIREMLVVRPHDFPKSVMMGRMLQSLTGESIFTSNGDLWRRQRTLLDPALEQARIRDSFDSMLRAADDALVDLDHRATGDGVVAIDDAMTHFTADVIFRTIYSEPIDVRSARRAFAAFRTFQKLAYAHGMVRLSGLPMAAFPGSLPAMFAAWRIRRVMDAPLKRRLAEHKAGAEPRRDILGTLLATGAGVKGGCFSPRELLDQICMIFLAGHETSASAIAWALYLLANSPEDQERVRREVEAAVGDGPLEFGHLRQLDFTRDVFREAMRLYPPVAFVARDATRPECLGKREVKPGSVIFMAPWLLHRNKTLWDRPDEFCPSRFATEEGKASAKSAFMPFSMGARVCPGAAFALQEGVMMLALVVRRFALEPAPRPDPVPFAKMTLNSANGIHIVMRGRPQGGRSPTHDSGAV